MYTTSEAINFSAQQKFDNFKFNVEFKAKPGLTVIFGRSGCGKTTLINMLAGLQKPNGGRIEIFGRCVFDKNKNINIPPEHRDIGYVFQESRLFPHMSVTENLQYGWRFLAPEKRLLKLDAIVEMLQLSPLLDRRPQMLSGGEKQRVAIGRAILKNPAMLLMDEPLASLDAQLKSEILQYIERLRDELSLSIVYVSHSIEEVVRLADTVLILDQGEKKAQGPVETVMSDLDLWPLTGRYEAGAVLAVTIIAQDTKFDLTELSFEGGRLFISKLDAPIGQRHRLRIRARDVSISLSKPVDTSILNVFHGTIVDIRQHSNDPQAEIKIDIGANIIARVTRKSMDVLSLNVGKQVYVMIKAAAIDRHAFGLRGTRVRR